MPPTTRPAGGPLGKPDYERLSHFRHRLRHFLRASELLCKQHGLTPLQYQLLLHVMGFPGRAWATVGELAERLQAHHHGVVALLDRCEARGLLERAPWARRPAHGRDPPAREGREAPRPRRRAAPGRAAAAAARVRDGGRAAIRRALRGPPATDADVRECHHDRSSQTLGEEIANSVSHGVALLAALVGRPVPDRHAAAARRRQRRRRRRVRRDDGAALPDLDAVPRAARRAAPSACS